MKSSIVKLVFQKVCLVLVLFVGVSINNTINAQSSNWKTEQQAESILLNQVAYYAQGLQNNPGSPAYNDALQHVTYYKGILRLIYGGVPVPEATEKALVDAAGALNDPAGVTVQTPDKNGLISLYNEAVALLTD